MSINDILNGQKSAPQFYSQLRGTTLEAAAAEPWKLSVLRKSGVGLPPKQVLPSGLIVTYAGALCYYCLQELLSKYSRKYMPDEGALEYMAKQMATRFEDWSVLDLPTFVDMCLCSRIASLYNGGMEYQLVTLDIPNIMGKVEAYDRMRPARTQMYTAPACPVRKPLKMKYKMTHKFGGVEYQWTDEKECQAYWDGAVDFNNPDEQIGRKKAGAQLEELCTKK